MPLDSVKAEIKNLMRATSVVVKQQDSEILIYNSQLNLLSRGVAVRNLNDARSLLRDYLHYIRAHGFIALTEFAESHQYRPVAFREVENKVDPQSAYAVKQATLSPLAFDRLAVTASTLELLASVDDAAVAQHLKFKLASSGFFVGAEQVDDTKAASGFADGQLAFSQASDRGDLPAAHAIDVHSAWHKYGRTDESEDYKADWLRGWLDASDAHEANQLPW